MRLRTHLVEQGLSLITNLPLLCVEFHWFCEYRCILCESINQLPSSIRWIKRHPIQNCPFWFSLQRVTFNNRVITVNKTSNFFKVPSSKYRQLKRKSRTKTSPFDKSLWKVQLFLFPVFLALDQEEISICRNPTKYVTMTRDLTHSAWAEPTRFNY